MSVRLIRKGFPIEDILAVLAAGLIPRKVYRAPKVAGTLRLFDLV